MRLGARREEKEKKKSRRYKVYSEVISQGGAKMAA